MKLFDFSGLRKQVRTLAEDLAGLRAQIENLRRQRDEIEHAPAARSDVKAALLGHVRARGAVMAGLLEKRLAVLAVSPAKLAAPSAAWAENAFGVAGMASSHYNGATPAVLDTLLFGLAPDLVANFISTAVDAAPWPAPGEGLPLAKRAAELAKLDEQIGELMKQERSLLTEARDAGLTIGEE